MSSLKKIPLKRNIKVEEKGYEFFRMRCNGCYCRFVYDVSEIMRDENRQLFVFCPNCGYPETHYLHNVITDEEEIAKLEKEFDLAEEKIVSKDYFTPEEVRNMSGEETRANYKKIIESMKKWEEE